MIQFQDMVRHSIMFFSQKDEMELEKTGDLYSVVSEVILDVLNGETPESISFPRFVSACSELRILFQQLIEVWKRREKLQREQMEAAGIAGVCTGERDKIGKALGQAAEFDLDIEDEEDWDDGIRSLDSEDEDDLSPLADANMENAV